MLESAVYSSFVGPDCKGNKHCFYISDELSSDLLADTSLRFQPLIIIGLTRNWFEQISQKENTFSAHEFRVFHNGREVFFCGSAATALSKRWHDEKTHRACKNATPPLLSLRDVELTLVADGLQFGFRTTPSYSAIPTTPNTQRDLEETLGTRCDSVFNIDDHYLIAEFSNPALVTSLTPKFEYFSKFKQAVIATAPNSEQKYTKGTTVISEGHNHDHRHCPDSDFDDTDCDYVMRYFAPQFGNPEDAATGSGNLILMRHWQSKLGKPSLCGRQLSKEGGLFFGRTHANQVSLLGNVSINKIRIG